MSKTTLIHCLFLAACAACLGAQKDAPPELPKEGARYVIGGTPVRIGRTIEITRSHIWCWFPTVHRFRSGALLVSVNMCPDEVNSESAFGAYCISSDGGETWSRRYSMGAECLQDAWSEDPDEKDQVWNWGSYPEPASPGDTNKFYAAMTKWGHDGRAISENRDISFTLREPAHMWPTWLFDYRADWEKRATESVADTRITDQFSGRPSGNIIRGEHGDLLCGAYYTSQADYDNWMKAADQNGTGRKWYIRVTLLRSTDGGKTWPEYSTVASIPRSGERPSWMGGEGPNECSLALLPDHRLYAVYRTGGTEGSHIGNSWSSDGGKTWTAPASIGFQGVAPRIHRLQNGMLALVTGRPGPVVLRLNPDGLGEKWSEPATLFGDRCTCYADLAEVAPGKLLVVYDSVPYWWYEIPISDKNARNRIYGTFVELGK